jgi:hypothetical protein
MAQSKLVDIKELERESGIPVRTLRSLYQNRKISFLKCGHRTLLFNTQQVMAELRRFEIKAIDP